MKISALAHQVFLTGKLSLFLPFSGSIDHSPARFPPGLRTLSSFITSHSGRRAGSA